MKNVKKERLSFKKRSEWWLTGYIEYVIVFFDFLCTNRKFKKYQI